MAATSNRRLEVVETEGGDETCQTFVLKGEDHTLGNPLRYVISKNPQVKFCGYTVPHPSECKINLRIQTYGAPAAEVFKKGLEDLQSICDHMSSAFEEAVKQHKEGHSSESDQNVDMSVDM